MKKIFVAAWLCVLFGIVAILFWYNEYRYSLPTPIPANYRPVKNGAFIATGDFDFKDNKPVFIHFFNPDCPCSRFNITHFKALVAEYGDRVNFAVVIMAKHNYDPALFKSKYEISNIPVTTNQAIATKCGVYSTPQAVILNPAHHLYYRGNYNRSRYCTDEKTEYAKMALQSLLTNQQSVKFSRFALQAYGCQTPNCTN